ncbi:efflux RND transporter periplasmic adaptor subunit [Roseobacter sp. YSTF-M11]|uniref:Efflux RND transporter periplasmic adaptor subunit n=1 Tax=Roseobacter insulae TaxID=2859783 RepID=A0A9X1G0T3_9RHOB|nr:efflux RND transporter periplasmic adaptor subunit [Roseobacter insulae]MBW4710839.1 efflux RND transporter periplasmic adaptor subunit [Roseobacter insulae]
MSKMDQDAIKVKGRPESANETPHVVQPSRKPMWMRRALGSALSLTLMGGIVASAAFAYHRIQEDASLATENAAILRTSNPVPVAADVAVSEDAYVVPRRYIGLVVPNRATTFGFEINGRVASIAVDIGDAVAAGDVLATLDQRRTNAALETAEAGLARARALLQLREVEVERAQSLRSSGTITQQSLDQALSNVQAARADVEASAAQIRSLQIDLEDTILRAPFDGEVIEMSFDLGDVVAPDRAILTMAGTGRSEAHIGVPVDLATRFTEGDVVSAIYRGREIEVEVRSNVSRVNAASQTMNLVVALSPDVAAIEGERIVLMADQTIEQRGIWVPVGALVSDLNGLFAVQIAANAEGDTLEIARAPVLVHYSDGQRAYVSGAIRDGDKIVTEGTNRVSPGQTVTVAAVEVDD